MVLILMLILEAILGDVGRGLDDALDTAHRVIVDLLGLVYLMRRRRHLILLHRVHRVVKLGRRALGKEQGIQDVDTVVAVRLRRARNAVERRPKGTEKRSKVGGGQTGLHS